MNIFIFSFLFTLAALFLSPIGQSQVNAQDKKDAKSNADTKDNNTANAPANTSGGGITFPLSADKSVILAGSSHGGEKMVWCYQKQENCHHDYNAADIFAATGTKVVAAVSGKITIAHNSGSVGHTVHLQGDDGKLYYHAHMGSITVSAGQNVKPGDQLGAVGTAADASNTPSHLHFDILPKGPRPSCSSAACKQYPFINPQPLLIAAFSGNTVSAGGASGGGPVKKVACVITKVGNPQGEPPPLPAECENNGAASTASGSATASASGSLSTTPGASTSPSPTKKP